MYFNIVQVNFYFTLNYYSNVKCLYNLHENFCMNEHSHMINILFSILILPVNDQSSVLER
jgi:hypothetical protein